MEAIYPTVACREVQRIRHATTLCQSSVSATKAILHEGRSLHTTIMGCARLALTQQFQCCGKRMGDGAGSGGRFVGDLCAQGFDERSSEYFSYIIRRWDRRTQELTSLEFLHRAFSDWAD